MFSSLPFSFLPLSRFVCRDKQCEMSQDAKKKSCSNRAKKKKKREGRLLERLPRCWIPASVWGFERRDLMTAATSKVNK